MIKKAKVAAAQLAPVFLQKEATVQKACEAIADAGREGADLIVFPEAYISGYPDWIWLIPNSRAKELNALYVELVDQAVSVPDETTDKLCQAAKKAGINVVVGMHERNTEHSRSSLYNSLLFIDRSGDLIGKHRKLIPTGGERLVWAQGDGSSLRAYDSSAGRLAGLICWENLMPLARYAIYQAGTQILAAPTWDKSPAWIRSMQHIAKEGGMFVISTCMALRKDDIPESYGFRELYPKDREWINVGNSCIVAPNGDILAGPLEAEEKILYAELDLNQITACKRMFDVAGHYARPDVFDFGLKTDDKRRHPDIRHTK